MKQQSALKHDNKLYMKRMYISWNHMVETIKKRPLLKKIKFKIQKFNILHKVYININQGKNK